MPGMGQTLTEKIGPMPTWAWVGLGTAGLGGYLIYRKKQQMNQQANAGANQSNLGTVPISNLTTAAEPMSYQAGDVFINNPVSNNQTVTNNPPGTPPGQPPPPKPPPIMKPPPKVKPIAKPPPPASPKPIPKQATTVTVCPWPQWCGSLWGIALHEYGDGTLWPQIYQANKALIGSDPNLIHPGQVLTIPNK